MTVGAVGQGMVAGDLVNTASRLQSVAPPGTVLVGESTYRATSEAIAFEPAGDHPLKGKASPVPAWRALRVVGMIGGAGRSDVLEPPFVGREAELRLVKELLHAATRERRLRLVSVIGQPGIGKSRLAWEFHKYIDGIRESIYWHQGRSPAYGEGITFWALGEMVRKRAGLIETDDAATTRARIAEALAEYVSDEAERRWIEPRLLQLLGVDEGGGGDRDELFAAWRTFFERVSEQGTVVLVFEDLHWADTGLLDFIDHLVEWSRGRPILVVTLARPELLERRPAWGAGRRNFVSLSLEPLTRDDMAELLDGLVPGLPDAMVRRDPGARRRDPAVRRRDDPDAAPRRPARGGRRHLSTGQRPDPPRRPRDAPRAHRGAPRRPRCRRSVAAPGCCRPRSDLQRRRPRSRVRPGTRGGRPRTCAPSNAASSSPRRSIRVRPSAGSGRSSRRSSARSATPPCRSATDAHATCPRLATSRASATTSWPGSRRSTTGTPIWPCPRAPRGRRSRSRRDSPCAAPPNERQRSIRTILP